MVSGDSDAASLCFEHVTAHEGRRSHAFWNCSSSRRRRTTIRISDDFPLKTFAIGWHRCDYVYTNSKFVDVFPSSKGHNCAEIRYGTHGLYRDGNDVSYVCQLSGVYVGARSRARRKRSRRSLGRPGEQEPYPCKHP
jgi:hypothetical protein